MSYKGVCNQIGMRLFCGSKKERKRETEIVLERKSKRESKGERFKEVLKGTSTYAGYIVLRDLGNGRLCMGGC